MVLKFWKDPNLKNGLKYGLKKISSHSFSLSMGKHFTKKHKKTANIFIGELYLCKCP